MIRLAIFASGNGSNAEVLCRKFKEHSEIEIACICTNNAEAGVIRRGQNLHIPVLVFSSEMLKNGSVLETLNSLNVQGVVLAGFLKLIPAEFIDHFSDAIVNIHPSLLPSYGGKGMYGSKVHEAVLNAGETYSGITIHLVNREYDKGQILFQHKLQINQGETPETLALRIHELEHRYFPDIVENYFCGSLPGSSSFQ